MYELPSTKEELERKTVEILDEMAGKLAQRRISRVQFGAAAHLLWKVTAGLVDSSVSGLCEAASLQSGHNDLKKTFVGPNGIVVIAWDGEADGYTVTPYQWQPNRTLQEGVTQFKHTPLLERPAALEQLFNLLRKQGFHEIH